MQKKLKALLFSGVFLYGACFNNKENYANNENIACALFEIIIEDSCYAELYIDRNQIFYLISGNDFFQESLFYLQGIKKWHKIISSDDIEFVEVKQTLHKNKYRFNIESVKEFIVKITLGLTNENILKISLRECNCFNEENDIYDNFYDFSDDYKNRAAIFYQIDMDDEMLFWEEIKNL